MFDFSGQTVLVTGATRGIGAALADLFDSVGASLILTGTCEEQIEELNEQHRNTRRLYVALDFTVEMSFELFLDRICSEFAVDVCINNAGINRIEMVDQSVQSHFDDVLDVNLRAPFRICRALIPGMKSRQYGRIVNIASIWSVITKSGRASYAASKAGLIGFTRTLSVETAPYNILVNSVSPGFTRTELTNRSLSAEEQARLAAQIPAGRLAEPKEIAVAVLFAASRENSYMTGQNLIVDGGFVNV